MTLSFPFVVRANEYGFYCIPEAQMGREVSGILAEGGVYEPATLRFLCRHLGDGDVVTGGTFIGDFLPALHAALAPGAQIHGFEPVPMTFEACQETIRLNGLDRVTVHNMAVSREAGEMTMMVQRPSGKHNAAGARIVEGETADGERYISIPTDRIDALVPEDRRVSLLHLDVEGHEIDALRGAARIIAASRPLVVLECDRDWRVRSYLEVLAEMAPGADYIHAGQMENNGIFRSMAE